MLNWLSRLFSGTRRGLRPAPHIESVALHNEVVWPNLAETEAQSRVYQSSSWVYVAVSRIAEAAALVPLRVFRLEGAHNERKVEVERHPLETLLDAPNPYLSRFELMEQTIGSLELAGNAYWFLAGDAASVGAPTEIWPLRPDRVSIVPHSEHYVRGYLYEIDGQRIPLEPEEVVHFKRWHPSNDYYGLSALEAARVAVASDRAMAEWNRTTFGKDNGVPAGIVSVKDYISDADFERLKHEWRSSYGGPQRRTAFLRGGTIEWKNIGFSHTDLDFLQGRQAHRDEILNIFGLPVGLVAENATEANAKVAERMFIERTLWPKLTRLGQKITQELLPFWPSDGVYVAEFDDIRPTDTSVRLDEIRASYPVLSINEIRERYYQLQPVTWGHSPVGANDATVRATHASPLQKQPQQNGANAADETATNDEPESSEAAAKSALDELGRWERFAVKRHGRSSGRAFEVRTLPDEVAFEVSAGLLAAETEAAVREVFSAARASLDADEQMRYLPV